MMMKSGLCLLPSATDVSQAAWRIESDREDRDDLDHIEVAE